MKKLLISIILLAVAGFLAFFIKDYIDRQNPDYAVAGLTVTADINTVSAMKAGYDWTFAFGENVKKETPSVVDLSIAPTELIGGEMLELNFSINPISYTVFRSGSYNYQFEELSPPFEVTYDKGAYIYMVDAIFPQGQVEYYFYILVT